VHHQPINGRYHDVQIRVLLAREGGRREVLRHRSRSDGVGGLLAEPGEQAGDRRRQIIGDGDPFYGPAGFRAERTIASRSSGFRRDSRSSRSSVDGASAMIRPKASVVTQEPAGTRMSGLS